LSATPNKFSDPTRVQSTISDALRTAGLRPDAPTTDVSATINHALAAAGLLPTFVVAPVERAFAEIIAPPPSGSTAPSLSGPAALRGGEFLLRTYARNSDTRNYKLYVPSSYAAAIDAPYPLVVMLHGCTQSADDFAAGTRMNMLAEQHGFLVAYPEQTAKANSSRCWNWFLPSDQQRDSGEPAIIAGITREIATHYRVDDRRMYVAGMSAGAAMALIVSTTYPELFAAVGVHSGLPYAAASDMPSAFAAMKGRARTLDSGYPDERVRSSSPATPTIVFHGDGDQTVVARNADLIVTQALSAQSNSAQLSVSTCTGSAGGLDHTCTRYMDGSTTPVVEYWSIHGAGHAWSGGSVQGSFSDTRGADASAEMIRFFFANARSRR
jgi:poly(hydroxyalkanoate) depolymerase family esterase